MSLSYCTECESVEAGFREPTETECRENDIPLDDTNHLECLICEACGAVGSYQGVPEHDDYDMER